MARKRKKKSRKAMSPEALRDHALTCLEKGRNREAVKAARQYLKSVPGDQAEDLLLKALLARSRSLFDSRLAADAFALLDQLVSEFPAARDQASTLRREWSVRLGYIGPILVELAGGDLSAGERRQLLDIVRDGALDLEEVTANRALPPGHSLRNEATAAARFFDAATSGPLPAGDAGPGSEVPRRSPFAPWALLGRAIQAAYGADDEALRRIARMIPESTPVSRCLPLVRCLCDGTRGDDLSTPGRRLLAECRGATVGVPGDLLRLERAFQARRYGTVRRLAREIHRELQKGDARHLHEFERQLCREWFAAGFHPDGCQDLLADGGSLPSRWWRFSAVAAETCGVLGVARSNWETYLEVRGSRAAPEEVALVRLRLASLAREERQRIGASFLRGTFDEFDGEFDEEDPADQRSHLEAAVEAFPSEMTYAPLLQLMDSEDFREAEAVALSWQKAEPGAVPPLLYLLAAAERRHAVRKALGLISRLEEISPGHPEVRAGRFRLLLAGAATRIRNGKTHLSRKDVVSLRGTPGGRDPSLRCLLDGLDWFSAETEAKREALRKALTHDLTSEGAVFLLGQMRDAMRAERFSPPLPFPCLPPAFGKTAGILARIGSVFDAAGWRLLPVTAWAKALRAEIEGGLLPVESDLLPLCSLTQQWEELDTLYLLSGLGLRLPGPMRHRFLLRRAMRLPMALEYVTRRRRCLRAALTLARRSGDDEAVREATQGPEPGFGHPLLSALGLHNPFGALPVDSETAPLPPEELTFAIEFEANEPLKRRRRSRRKKRGRGGQRTIFDF